MCLLSQKAGWNWASSKSNPQDGVLREPRGMQPSSKTCSLYNPHLRNVRSARAANVMYVAHSATLCVDRAQLRA